MQPLVSVVIATYNRARLVGQAIESVLNQTYDRIEIVVVDDGSTDDTHQLLNRYHDQIIYFYQERSERSKARNKGFILSTGDYVAFLDSDDLWFPTKVEEQVRILQRRPDVAVVYTGVQFIDDKGRPCASHISWEERRRRDLYEDLMTRNVINGSTSSVMVRRRCVERVGLFDERMISCEDLDLWRRLAEHYRFFKIDEPLVKCRIHAGNTQADLSTMAKGYEMILKKISEYTPQEFAYYRNEAIIKLFYQTAQLYIYDHNFYEFVLFCFKTIWAKPARFLSGEFWREAFRLTMRRLRRAE